MITRVFRRSASRRLRRLTQPELVKRWMRGPPGWSLVVCKIDLKVGGAYRYVWQRDCDGADMAIGGVFWELMPSERTVHTEKFDNTTTFRRSDSYDRPDRERR